MKTNKFKVGDRVVIVESQETTPEFSAHSYVAHAGVVQSCYSGVFLPPHCGVMLDGEEFFRHCDERCLMLESEYWRLDDIKRFRWSALEWSQHAQLATYLGRHEDAAKYHSNATRCMAVARSLLNYSDAAV